MLGTMMCRHGPFFCPPSWEGRGADEVWTDRVRALEIFMTLPLFATQQPDPVATRSCAQRLFDVATILAGSLTQSQIPTRHALRKLMTASFGASDAQGAWSMRQAYDALEIALILFLRRGNSGIARSGDPTACYAALRRLETSLPTHSYRSEQQI